MRRCTKIKIEPFPVERTGELAKLYNACIANVPLCEPVSAEIFAARSFFWRDSTQYNRVREQRILVALQENKPVGFAHVAIGRFPGPELHGDDLDRETGAIRFFSYPRGERGIGQSLLEAVEAHLIERDVGRILAFPNNGYVFHRLSFGELSDRCGHIIALFGMNGYNIVRGEVYLGWRDFEAIRPAPVDETAEVLVQHTSEEGGKLPNLSIKIRLQHQDVGACEGQSLGLWGDSSKVNATIVLGFDVEDAFQGRGWGLFLLQTALFEAKQIGYRHTATSTSWRNYRAMVFYTNYGYASLDTAYSFRKKR